MYILEGIKKKKLFIVEQKQKQNEKEEEGLESRIT